MGKKEKVLSMDRKHSQSTTEKKTILEIDTIVDEAWKRLKELDGKKKIEKPSLHQRLRGWFKKEYVCG